jgi:hypothetical protein
MTNCETLYVEIEGSHVREVVTQFFCGLGIDTGLDGWLSKHKMLEFAKGPGFSADALRITGPDSYVACVTQLLGFTPTVKVMLFYDRFAYLEPTRSRFLQATMYLVHNTSYNIGLRFQDQKTVLLRVHGQLHLNNCPDVWTPQRLQRVLYPYIVTELNPQLEHVLV